MGLHILEGLQHPEGFINTAAHGQVVDRAVHDCAIGIDDEEAAQGHSGFVVEDVIGAGDLFLQVGNQGVVDVTNTTVFALGLNPGQVAELAIHRDTENFRIATGEIGVTIAEGDDFSRANEGEIEGIEEQDHIFAPVVRQANGLELLVHHGRGREIRGLLANPQATGACHGIGRENVGD